MPKSVPPTPRLALRRDALAARTVESFYYSYLVIFACFISPNLRFDDIVELDSVLNIDDLTE